MIKQVSLHLSQLTVFVSADMRDLIEREAADVFCAEAVAIFCYQVRKFIGAYVAALGGLDTLVFTGGIGQSAATIRERICAEMDCMGITLDPRSNASNASVISTDDSPVTVRVIKTDEDLIVARHTCRVVTNLALSGGPRPRTSRLMPACQPSWTLI